MVSSRRVSKYILRNNKVLIIALMFVLGFLALGIPKLQISSDNRSFFSGDNQEYADLKALDETYSGSNSLLIMIVPPKDTVFSVETLEAMQRMTADTWQIPYVLRVDSPINYTHSYARDDDIIIEPLLDEFDEITKQSAIRFHELAPSLPELRNRLLDENQSAYGLNIQVVLPDNQTTERQEISNFVHDLVSAWQGDYPDFEFRLTGVIFGGLTLAKVALDDITTLVPMSLLAVIILFVLLLGSYRAVLISLCVIVAATIATFGYAGWTGVVLTAGTAISPLSVMVLTAGSCVHIILSWLRGLGVSSGPVTVENALTDNLGAVTVTNVTTAVGFLGLNFAQSPPLQEMGNIVAFGLMFGLSATFIILPYGLLFCGKAKVRRMFFSSSLMNKIAAGVINRHRFYFVTFVFLILAAAGGITKIGFDDSIIRYFDDRYEFRRDADAIQARLTGLENLQFSFKAPKGESVFDPTFLRKIDRFAIWLEQQDKVVSVSTVSDLLKQLNKSMNRDDPNHERIADTREANAQLMMLYELSLPVGLDLNSSIDVDRKQTRVTALIRSSHSSDIRSLAIRSENWLKQNEPDIFTRASGISIAFARISQRNNAQMLVGLILVLILVSATMMFTLRSLKFGIISLVPNLVPAILAFGFWGFTFGNVNLGSTVVTTMTFGIVVDDTVHFLMHYMRARKNNASPVDALKDTFSVVGAALIITSLALIVGFLIMASSGFVINQHIGALTALIVLFALLADLLFLPAVLLFAERNRK